MAYDGAENDSSRARAAINRFMLTGPYNPGAEQYSVLTPVPDVNWKAVAAAVAKGVRN